MTSSVGIRELKTHAGEIVRRVRDDRTSIDITYRGEVVARIVPTSHSLDKRDAERIWQQRRELLLEIAQHGHDDVSAVEAVEEIRRLP